jgi:tripartite-type tricarboxylate transporter receptor subunit TctC
VAYRRRALAVADPLDGRLHPYFSTLAVSIDYIRAGKLRALAVTAASRDHRAAITISAA